MSVNIILPGNVTNVSVEIGDNGEVKVTGSIGKGTEIGLLAGNNKGLSIPLLGVEAGTQISYDKDKQQLSLKHKESVRIITFEFSRSTDLITGESSFDVNAVLPITFQVGAFKIGG